MRTYLTTFQVVFFLKGNVVQELLDFISKECQIKLGENLHWARREQLLGIEDAAEKPDAAWKISMRWKPDAKDLT